MSLGLRPESSGPLMAPPPPPPPLPPAASGIKGSSVLAGVGEREKESSASEQKKKSDDLSLTAGNRFHVHLPPKASQRHPPKRIAAAAAFA